MDSMKQPLLAAEGGAPPEAENPNKQAYQTDMHILSLEDVGLKLGTSINAADPNTSKGLSTEEAQSRLLRDGPNALTPPKTRPEWVKFLMQFTNMFMVLLLGAGVLSCVAYGIQPSNGPINLYLGIVLFAVVFLTCCASYYQEGKTSKVMDLFKTMLPAQCTVVRDGHIHTIPASELVVGDLVRVRSGDKIPADLRIISVQGLAVDNSSITGESDPILSSVTTNQERPLEARNLVFNSSLCLDGSAFGVVIKTGDRTLIGSIAAIASGTTQKPTTLHLEVNYFVKFITILSLVMGTVFFIIGVARDPTPLNVLNTFVNGFIIIIVANVPQGLPATVTSVLTVTAQRMAKRDVFVKRLESVETLGSVSVICSDKTGTLTQNVMTVTRAWVPGRFMQTEQFSDASQFPVPRDPSQPFTMLPAGPAGNLALISTLNSRIEVEHPEPIDGQLSHDAEPVLTGDATEKAIYRFNSKISGASNEIFRKDVFRKVFEIPFNSKNKFQVCIYAPVSAEAKSRYNNQRILTFKGAPEVVLGRCTTYTDKKGREHNIDETFLAEAGEAFEHFGSAGERVLGFGELLLPADKFPPSFDDSYVSNPEWNFPSRGFRFVGMLSMCDPPRPGVLNAVLKCHTAGINVIMVTGDHPSTAHAIACKVGIIKPHHKTLQEVLRDYAIEQGSNHESETASLWREPVNEPSGYSQYEETQSLRFSDDEEEPNSMRRVRLASFAANRGGKRFQKTIQTAQGEVFVGPPSSIADPRVSAAVIHGQELERMTVEEIDAVLDKEAIVFARTTPQQKLTIVERLQARGKVIAMTGDGVNDSPALRQANIGVAMGLCGSAVAREASDIILMNDDFTSIVYGVQEGRVVFDNLKKTIAYTLSHLLAEMVPVMLNLAISMPQGLSSMQILMIDLGTELAPAISLSFEKAEANVMDRPARDPKRDRLVSLPLLMYAYLQAGLVHAVICLLAYLFVFSNNNVPYSVLPQLTLTNATDYKYYWTRNSTNLEFIGTNGVPQNLTGPEQVQLLSLAQAAWFTTLVMGQFFHIWMCKTRIMSVFRHGLFNNKQMNIGVFVEIGLMLFIVYVPPTHTFFDTPDTPMNPIYFIPCLASGLILWFYNEFRKRQFRRLPKSIFSQYFFW